MNAPVPWCSFLLSRLLVLPLFIASTGKQERGGKEIKLKLVGFGGH